MSIITPDNNMNDTTGQKHRSLMLPYGPGPSAMTAEANFFQASFPLYFTVIGPSTEAPNNAQTPVGKEAIVMTLGRTLHAVQVSGTFVGTVKVEATIEHDVTVATWKTLDSLTTADLKQYTGIYNAFRITISAYTSGTPLVTVMTQR